VCLKFIGIYWHPLKKIIDADAFFQINTFFVRIYPLLYCLLLFFNLFEAQTDEEITIEWFNSLRLGIIINRNSPELRRLVQVRAQMILLQNNCPGFLNEAIRFAREMSPRNVSQFCNYLKFFETEFVSEREKLIRMNNQDYQNETANQKPKISKKKWACKKNFHLNCEIQ
jgi:hypothetical protein